MTVGLLFLYSPGTSWHWGSLTSSRSTILTLLVEQLLSLAEGRQLAMICITENWREVGSQDIGAIVSQCLHTELCEFAGWLRTQQVAQMLIWPPQSHFGIKSPWESLNHVESTRATNCSQWNHVLETGTAQCPRGILLKQTWPHSTAGPAASQLLKHAPAPPWSPRGAPLSGKC